MRIFTVFTVLGMILAAGCQMPGVEEVAEEIEGQVEEIEGQVETVTDQTDELRTRLDDLEDQLGSLSPTGEIEIPEFDTAGITEELNQQLEQLNLRTDSILGLMEMSNDSLKTELMDTIEEQALIIDSLRDEIESLEWEIYTLDDRIDALGANTGDAGRDGSTSSSSSGGRTGSSSSGGSSSGGSSGGRS